jgi:hypothetical protein
MSSHKKQDLPFQKFYWGDWFKSLDVRALPLSTRAVWFEMIGLMWESSERGYLTLNGKPAPDKAIACMLCITVEEFQEHLAVIEDAKLFSRRESDGAIFSRKILHDEGLREMKASAGRYGGLATQRHKSAIVHAADETEKLGYPGEPTEEEKLRANELALAGVRE